MPSAEVEIKKLKKAIIIMRNRHDKSIDKLERKVAKLEKKVK